MEQTKKCSVCKQVKCLGKFYGQNKRRKNGTTYIYYNPECKECTKNRSEKWRKENPKSFRKIVKKRDAKVKARLRKRKYGQRYRDSGKRKKWEDSNKDKIKKYTFLRNVNKKHNISNEEWEKCLRYFDYCCSYCGMTVKDHINKYGQQLHKEHVDHNGSNEIDNCVPACRICNASKRTSPLEEWYKEDNKLCNFSQERLNKIHKWIKEDHKQ